jgi:6-phosphogluconolactonase
MSHPTRDWGIRGTLRFFSDEKDMARQASAWLAQRIRTGLLEYGTFHLVLAGGNTPALCYDELAHEPLDWKRVTLSLGDERCLPIGHPERNDTLIQRHLLVGKASKARFITMQGEHGPDQAALDHTQRWQEWGPIDLALLGMGEDGHTASLFPDNPVLDILDCPVVAVRGAPKPPSERVSLSLSALQSARERVFLVTGSKKREALERLDQGEPLPSLLVGPSQWFIELSACPTHLIPAT